MTILPLNTDKRVPTPTEYIAWIRAANEHTLLFDDAWIASLLSDYAECVRRHTRAKIDAANLAAAKALDDDMFALAARCNEAAYAVRDALANARAE